MGTGEATKLNQLSSSNGLGTFEINIDELPITANWGGAPSYWKSCLLEILEVQELYIIKAYFYSHPLSRFGFWRNEVELLGFGPGSIKPELAQIFMAFGTIVVDAQDRTSDSFVCSVLAEVKICMQWEAQATSEILNQLWTHFDNITEKPIKIITILNLLVHCLYVPKKL